jgi:hypothetical protein
MQPKPDREHLRRKAAARVGKLGVHNERITQEFASLWSDYANQMMGHATAALKHGRVSPGGVLRDTFAASVEAVGSAFELYGQLWKACLEPGCEDDVPASVVEFEIDTASEAASAMPLGNCTVSQFAQLSCSDLEHSSGAKIPARYMKLWKLAPDQVGIIPSGLGEIQPLALGVYLGKVTYAPIGGPVIVVAGVSVTVRNPG